MKQILKTDIKRESGKLYFCKTGEDGCLIVCEAKMNHGGKKKKSKSTKSNRR